MPETAAKCECGAEYDVEVEETPPPAKPEPKKAKTKTEPKPAREPGGGDDEADPADTATADIPEKCWSCGCTDIDPETGKCDDCGIETTDDLPFG
jgi:hypothetical protein